jgi:hypothetical protein
MKIQIRGQETRKCFDLLGERLQRVRPCVHDIWGTQGVQAADEKGSALRQTSVETNARGSLDWRRVQATVPMLDLVSERRKGNCGRQVQEVICVGTDPRNGERGVWVGGGSDS